MKPSDGGLFIPMLLLFCDCIEEVEVARCAGAGTIGAVASLLGGADALRGTLFGRTSPGCCETGAFELAADATLLVRCIGRPG